MGKRKINGIALIIAISLCFSFCTQATLAQSPLVKTFVDRSDILIGEQIKYKVTAAFPSGVYKVHWFTVPDSVAHFEIVDRSKIDTVAENNITTLQQIITLTSFDSGKWNTPAFIINFDPVKDDTTINIFTDSIAVNVGYAAADTSGQLRDIKPIIEVTVKNYLWYYIAGGILLLLVTALILWRYFKNKRKNPVAVTVSKILPYQEAMQSLEKLKAFNLQNPGEVKKFHAQLSEIFKWYISRKQKVSIMNKTTADVLIHLAENNLPKDIITNTAIALRCGDAVKFAKYLPALSESEACFTKIKETINFIHSPKLLNS
jgi:hypothetical protein